MTEQEIELYLPKSLCDVEITYSKLHRPTDEEIIQKIRRDTLLEVKDYINARWNGHIELSDLFKELERMAEEA